jgi:hypothetical protein
VRLDGFIRGSSKGFIVKFGSIVTLFTSMLDEIENYSPHKRIVRVVGHETGSSPRNVIGTFLVIE